MKILIVSFCPAPRFLVLLSHAVPHRAGETLRGTVRVCGNRPLSKGELSLRMYGKEKVAIRRGHGENRVTSRAQCEFFSSQLVLRDFARDPVAQAGVFEAPFAIVLPESLPASASHATGPRDVGFRIQYKIRAQLPSNHKSEVYVMVHSAPLPSDPIPSDMDPISVPIKTFFRKRGIVTLGAHADDTLVSQGETLHVHLACHNESSALVQRVEVRLLECVRWKTHRHDQREIKILDVLQDVSHLPGLACHDTARGRSAATPDPVREREIISQALLESRRTGCNQITLRVPSHARDSYYGQLVQVWHMVEIRLKTSHLTTNPSKSIAVRVGSSRREPREVAVAAAATATTLLPVVEGTPVLQAQTVLAPPAWQVRTVTPPPLDDDDCVIPMACAVPLPKEPMDDDEDERVIVLDEEAIVALTATAPMEVPAPCGSSSSPAKSASAVRGPVTLPNLLHAMHTSVSSYDLVQYRLHQVPEWQCFFAGLTPPEYGQVVAAVRTDMDQTRLAEELAQYVQPAFTCAHAAAAVQMASDWNRSNLAQRLLPLCSIDLPEQHQLISQHLNEWERTITARDFEDAVEAARRRRVRRNSS